VPAVWRIADHQIDLTGGHIRCQQFHTVKMTFGTDFVSMKRAGGAGHSRIYENGLFIIGEHTGVSGAEYDKSLFSGSPGYMERS